MSTNLKINDTNELTKQEETHRLRKRIYGCQGDEIVRELYTHIHTAIFKMDSQGLIV